MTIWAKMREYLRRQLAEARRNRACNLWMYSACLCGALVGGFFLDGGRAGAVIGALLFAFIVAVVFVGKDELDMKEEKRNVLEVVAALVFDEEGRVLATQCAPHKHGGGWEFPGGKIEPGEAVEAAVVREIAEELSLEIEVRQFLHTVNWRYPAFHLRMHCYVCTLRGGNLTLREHVASRWLTVDELYSLEWLPADVDVLPWLARYMKELR